MDDGPYEEQSETPNEKRVWLNVAGQELAFSFEPGMQ